MTTKQGVQVTKMEAHGQVKPNIVQLACEFSPLFWLLATRDVLQERRARQRQRFLTDDVNQC